MHSMAVSRLCVYKHNRHHSSQSEMFYSGNSTQAGVKRTDDFLQSTWIWILRTKVEKKRFILRDCHGNFRFKDHSMKTRKLIQYSCILIPLFYL
jgi:hypothetical protein